jgi:WD40 repeat protein
MSATARDRRKQPHLVFFHGAALGPRRQPARHPGGNTGQIGPVFALDGSRIVTASDVAPARLWDRDGKPLATLQGHTAGVNSAVFSPDGRSILTASDYPAVEGLSQSASTGRSRHSTNKPIGCSEEGSAVDGTKSLFREAQHRCIRTLSLRYKPLTGGTVHSLWLWGKHS